MSDISIEDDPDPLPELRNGLHYYDVHDFLSEIVRPDSRHTLQYREWYSECSDTPDLEENTSDQASAIIEFKEPVGRTTILRWLGRFAHFSLFE